MTAVVTGVLAYSLLALIAASAVPAGVQSWSEYIDNLGAFSGYAGLPTFNAVNTYMGASGMTILGVAVSAAIMTGLIGNTVAASRLIYSLARENIFHNRFKALNRFGAPYRAILCIMALSAFIPFFGRTAISWIVDVNTVGATIAYVYTSFSAYTRAKKEKKLRYMITGMTGFIVSLIFTLYFLIPNLWTVGRLSSESYLILILWSLLGFVTFYFVLARDKDRHFGRRIVVWIGVLFFVLFISMLWFREASDDVSRYEILELEEHYDRHLAEHDVILDKLERIEDESFLDSQVKTVTDTLQRNSFLQMGIILLTLFLMFRIYGYMQKRERDLEVQKRTAEENSRAKSAFLSAMSHDIRTPMNAVIGYTEITKNIKGLPKDAKDNLDKIEYSGKYLLSIINDVLDMSRIENGRMELEPETADLKKIIREVQELFGYQMSAKNIDFKVRVDVHDRYVFCDTGRLSRILQNLVSNAIKYTPDGGAVTMALTQNGKTDGKGHYSFRVKDNGIGMSPDFAATIFDAYTREDDAAKIQGTGLGMAITRSFVELMGGNISVQSQKGKGSEFTVDVDFEIISRQEYAKENLSVEAFAKRDYSSIKVLVVEDQVVNREIACRILSRFGFLYDYAENGKMAVDMINDADPDTYRLVLMDVQMPVMNGYEASIAIRNLEDPAKSTIPIIAMTANAFSEDVKKAQQCGMDAHIAKPIEIEKMLAVINEFI